ncbi:ComEA family DNA-binding protein [Paenibacillus glycanilyticus]|uniref:ComEA family DNA-binding protein n=1 Tax=Paenibacillus glycanilyticus TaxID=126569 RepID=UPI00203FFD6E|nr:ComEA family DNA-binding protein [Paenibacillus glycanilyticus]MCM3627237.1 ComEA family DNA-binding protein [Paenibacillus glycanilyticus]
MARLLSGRRTNTNGNRLIIPLLLIAAAAILLAAALAQPKEKAPDDWVQLNREVGNALHVQAETKTEDKEIVESGTAKAEVPSAVPPSDNPITPASSGGKGEAEGKLDINRASAEQLDTLKGIGPAKAQAIIADREQNGPFQSVDDLLRVKGIGSKLLAGIKDSIVATP